MKKLLSILSVLVTFIYASGQDNINPAIQTFNSRQQAISTKMAVGVSFSVTEDSEVSTFIVQPRSDGYLMPDSVMVIAMKDSVSIAVRQNKEIKVEWFKKPGETDYYNALQREAAYVSGKSGIVIKFNAREYGIDTMKTGTPKFKTNVITRDSFYVDTSGVTNDTVITQIIDTVLTVSQTYIPNGITNVIWKDLNNVQIVGYGAKFNIKGDFDRKWTHSTASGYTHMSAYNTVCPFEIWWGQNVSVKGIEVNGNDDKMTETQTVNEGDDYALVFRGTEGITVKDCFFHHLATDGLYIEGSGKDLTSARHNYHSSTFANVENVTTLYCGRQGLTIGALYIATFKDCNFSATGDTTGMGAQPYAYRGHAPQKGIDIEPIFEYAGPSGTLIRTNHPTTGILFINCTITDNRGGSVALSHPYTVNGVTFRDCNLDNSKYNRIYNVISTIPGLTFDNCNINTGTGGMYVTRDQGGLQRVTIKNSTLISGGSGFIAGAGAQYGALVENNWIIGRHDTSYHLPFPVISSNAIFKNNTIVLDSGLFMSNTLPKGGQVYCQIAEGNTWISQVDTTGGRPKYPIYYTYPKAVRNEIYTANQAVAPVGGWDASHLFTTGEMGLGRTQIVYLGGGKSLAIYWLPALPTTGQYNAGDIVNIIIPVIGGYDHYKCSVAGDAALGTVQWIPIGAITATGTTNYLNGFVKDVSDIYLGRNIDSSGTNKYSYAFLPANCQYFTKTTNDTGIVAFKTPLAFNNSGEIIIKGTIYIRGKGNADFTVSTLTLGNKTFNNNNLTIRGDSSLQSLQVRWLKDLNNDTYLSFFDTATIIVKQTNINIESISLSGSTQSYLSHAAIGWNTILLKSLSGFTATNIVNTSGVNYNTLGNKPVLATVATSGSYTDLSNKPAIPAQFNPTASTGMTITGSYPNMTFSSTGAGGVNVYGNQLSFQQQIGWALGSSIITETFSKDRITTTATMTSGQLKLSAIWLPVDTTLTGAKWYQAITGVYTANNYNGIGLYSYNTATGVATLVASTANDGTIWQAAGGWASKPFSSTYAATKGLYFIGMVYSTSTATTAPSLGTCTNVINALAITSDFTNGGKLVGILSSQTSLPSSITFTSTAGTTIQPYGGVY